MEFVVAQVRGQGRQALVLVCMRLVRVLAGIRTSLQEAGTAVSTGED